jgi:hypothetical protein
VYSELVAYVTVLTHCMMLMVDAPPVIATCSSNLDSSCGAHQRSTTSDKPEAQTFSTAA